ncbi:hypothetical protein F3Y22_tig00111810pilonHSYRG00082 [Hibiscus syriacus]|uniref:Uncharacterized protein n=1 Tax=Hibiscus syriacus TaxID=106335 RepID=A0A6A2XC10_HIBSY|nr:hypothetical protein F3Y22_tig00111810pilonHSYRG00082 [Hibiscus syriacus]
MSNMAANGLDLALVMDEPTKPTDTSLVADKKLWENCERSNMHMMSFLKLSIAPNIKPSQPKTENFKTLDMDLGERVLVEFMLKSCKGDDFKQFRRTYNQLKEKWSLLDTKVMLLQEEARQREDLKVKLPQANISYCGNLNGGSSGNKAPSHYQSNPGLVHWRTTKKVLRYLQGTKDHMLTYRRTSNLEVVGYSDSDYVGYSNTRKSTFDYVFLLADGAISRKSGLTPKTFIGHVSEMGVVAKSLYSG